ncbi:ABC transporter permease [Paenibacillus tundrae]|uniref:Peptide/nickel transport system permease protein n=1 Tax=Paenibacillus tundrae TaxID=528187 RepID=A0ABT9WDI5_9BACL|nr:ABC transporter permease [Paenibacillus tundrae]MDQ0171185.1 peptide/nickel transport system permease protein [Paenibacillus tundrae]
MNLAEGSRMSRLAHTLGFIYDKMLLHPSYRYVLFILGLPVNLIVLWVWRSRRQQDGWKGARQEAEQEMLTHAYRDQLRGEIEEQLRRKHRFFKQHVSESEFQRETQEWLEETLRKEVNERTAFKLREKGQHRTTMADTFRSLINHPLFFVLSLIPGCLMYGILLLYGNPYLKYIFERLLMTIFVIMGVATLVFTILYLSPFNPAANILGETATPEQIAAFNHVYGLDQPYLVQLWNNIKGIALFDLGKSFAGNEDVTATIARKFPITLTLAVISLLIAIVIALPIGIISAIKPNSLFDYTFMFIALIGLSIPNFWQGLIFILNFSIKMQWLPATFNPQNWLSMIMPTIVLGTGLTAAVARMTRSSTLEVIHEDYVMTARAKGLSERHVLLKHAVRNALIPIVTVVGLQFGGMLGGAAVTEKVFNISGLGSYIVDKQFIPDIPSIMGGVVYTAITISIINVIVDLMYAFIDPRVRSKMKQY